MNKAIGMLAGATLLVASCGAGQASTFNFTISDGHGTGPFGTLTTTIVDSDTTHVVVNMSPNWIIENGGSAHHAFTFSTTLPGTIENLSAGFSALPHHANADYDNKPFTGFTDAIVGVNCLSNGSGGCGSVLSFDISNYGAFTTADAFNMNDIFAAVDICQKSLLPGECTFVVGLGDNPTPGTFDSSTPIPGAVWLFGTVLAGGAGFGRWRKKRKQAA